MNKQTFQRRFLTILPSAKADDPQMTIHKGGDANEHVMQELNRACETPTLSLPNDDGTFRGMSTS